MSTPTQQLKNIRLVISGDIYAWMKKVDNLIEQGADPKVLDITRDGYSIITSYVISGMQDSALFKVVKFLLEKGVSPTNEVFVSCLMHSPDLAELVMVASGNSIAVNTLDIYGTPVHTWVMQDIFKNKRRTTQVKYLISKGLQTNAKAISIEDLLALV